MTGIGVWAGAGVVFITVASLLVYWKRLQLHYQRERGRLRVAHLRRSIAANLHDELGSLLMRVHMQAEAMRHQPTHDDAGLERLLATTQAALLAMRDVAWGLDPSADTVNALQDRMRDLLDQMAPTTPLHISFATEGLDNIVAIPGWMRQEIYQVFKEATTNVVRHAKGATCLAVRLYGHNGSLKLEIKDDGTPSVKPRRSGMGLRNMNLRAQAVAGELHTGPRTDGPGFQVCLVVPLNPAPRPSWLEQWVR
jgi:signal transduction histidine kinase